MSKYADIEQIKEVIRTEWVKYMPMELDMNLSFVLGKISEVPTIEVSEDCISRAKALEIYSDLYWMDERLLNFKSELDNVYEKLRNAPSVVPTGRKTRQVERAEGEWIRTFDGNEWYWYCSNCKEQWYEDDLYMGGNEFPNYCPNCGAKMKGE